MKRILTIAVSLALLLSAFSGLVPGVTASESQQRLSDFGIKLVGGPSPAGAFAGPSWIANEGSRIYVVDELNVRVHAILKDGNPQYAFGLYGSHEKLITEPGGITCYQNKIYWVDRFYGKIVVRGNKTDDVIEDTELKAINPSTGKSYFVHPNGISAYKGLLYVANTGARNIVVIDTNDKFSSIIPTTDGENYTFIEPNGIAVNDDKIFVADTVAGKIFCFDKSGTFISSFGDGTSPYAIVALDNRVYVTDIRDNKVRVYSYEGADIDSFGSPGNGIGQISIPKGIAILDSKIYVSSFANNRVDVFKIDGTYSSTIGGDVKVESSFATPRALAISDGKIAIADTARSTILIYDRNAKFEVPTETTPYVGFVSEFGKRGTGEKELLRPVGVDFDSQENRYVVDAGNHCVKVFDINGKYQRTIGEWGMGNGRLNNPSDVVVVSSLNKIFVTDTGNNLIQVFSTTGEFLAQFGGFGSAPGQFIVPKGITSDGRKLLVADAANCRVQELTLDGTYIRHYGHKGRGEGMLFFPSDCAYDESGMVYVADTYNDRIVVFDNDSKMSWDYGRTGGPGRVNFFSVAGWENYEQDRIEHKEAKGYFTYPEAVVCDDQGVYVADTMNHRLQIIPYRPIFEFPRVDEAMFTPQRDQNVYFTVAPNNLDFGVLKVGSSSQKRIEIRNWTGGMLSGTISIEQNVPFVSVEPKNFVGDVIMVDVKVDTTGMAAGQEMTAKLTISTNKGVKEIPLSVIPSDAYGITLHPETNLFVEIDCQKPATLEIMVEPQNEYERNVSLTYAKPRKKCVVPEGEEEGKHPHRDVKNVDCNGFALTALNIEFSPSTIKLGNTNKTSLIMKPRGDLKPGIYEIVITLSAPGTENGEVQFSFVLLINPCTEPEVDKLVPRTLLTETFTAVWCQYCPFHREAQYRMADEYGYSQIIPIAYYCDADSDNSGMTQPEHHHRYRWYTQEGLPTTMFNGIQNFSEGDGPYERQDPPPDRLPDRKMSGTSYSYWRFAQRAEDYRAQTSPIKLFLQGQIDKTEGYADLEITSYQDLSGYRDLAAYIVLVENNVEFAAVNGEEEHHLTVMKMLHEKGKEPPPEKGHLGDPIEIPVDETIHKTMTFALPHIGHDYDWLTQYKNCFLVAWIQDNTTKEILQSTMCDLRQPLIRRFTLTQKESDLGVQAGSLSKQSYVLTNLGNVWMDFELELDHKSGEVWDKVVSVDSVPSQDKIGLRLQPMQSSVIDVVIDVPPDVAEGTESNYKLIVNEISSGLFDEMDIDLLVEPAKPPSFEIKSVGTSVVEVAPGQSTQFKVLVDSINEYDNPVMMQLGTDTSDFFTATFEPPNGVPPFECTVSLKASDEMVFNEDGYNVTIVGVGSNSRGETFEKTASLKAKARKLEVELLPERHIITSCAVNEICRQTEVKVNVKGGLEVKEALLDFVYDDQYLDVTHVSLGSYLTRYGEQPTWSYEHRPGRITVSIRREESAVAADQDENILVTFTMKAAGDKIVMDNIRIGLENVRLTGDVGNKIITILHDDILSIRKNAKPPEVLIEAPKKITSPWPTEEEAKRRREEHDLQYADMKTNESSVFIKGKLKSEEGLAQLSLFIGGHRVSNIGQDGSIDYTYPLREGFNNIVIIAQNFTGETDAINLIVYRDTSPPMLTVIEPNENLLGLDYSMKTPKNTIEFMGYTDADAKVTIKGEAVKIQEDKFTEEADKVWYFQKNVSLVEGENIIEIKACDEFNNCRSYQYKITYEKGAVQEIIMELWIDKPIIKINGIENALDAAPVVSSPPLPPELANNTYMPIRAVAEALYCKVGWEGTERKVTLTQNTPDGASKFVELWIAKPTARINGVETRIHATANLYPTIVNSRTMLPLRFVAETLGAAVGWDGTKRKVTLTYPDPGK